MVLLKKRLYGGLPPQALELTNGGRRMTKIRFIEPGGRGAQKRSIINLFTYNKFIRNPSTGLILLATIAKELVPDTLMYSEAITDLNMSDVLDADMVFIGINTFSAMRGYELAEQIKSKSSAVVVLGGLHATLNYTEAATYADFVLLGEGEETVPALILALTEGKNIDFPGVVYKKEGELMLSGAPVPPAVFETLPDRNLVYGYKKVATYDTLWPQVHASRGCPHHCDYCTVVKLFGHKVRTRDPQRVVEEIRQAVAFHKRRVLPRLNNVVWITDDNFHADRPWALSFLRALIDSGLTCRFSVQARYELGFDDELLSLMKKAGFIEVAMGIEFIDDAAFREFHKNSCREEIIRSIQNIKKHGIGVRGLFIVDQL